MASNRLWGSRDTTKVILDSSAAMMPFEFMIDLEKGLSRILGSFQILVPSSVYRELVFLSKNGKGRKKRLAKTALELIKNYEVVDTSVEADDAVLNLALKENGIVFTNDKELRKRAKQKSLKTIYLRGKHKLVLE